MSGIRFVRRRALLFAGLAAPAVVLALPLGAADNFVERHDLVADVPPTAATNLDINLVNPWGVAFSPTGFAWVADNGTGKSTLYDGFGVPQGLVVTIPAAPGGTTGKPTGIVFNATTDFVESNGVAPDAPASFLFASEDGLISGWNGNIDGVLARVVADDSASGAIYKGLALANNGEGNFLFATDFHNGKIVAFDSKFQHAVTLGGFVDKTVPKGFAPFGIRNIGGALYVTYARQDGDRVDDVHGRGLGVVNVFDANGFRLRRLATRAHLNAPWGLAVAPASFSSFGGRLLVGNFGDGTIQSFDLASGRYRGALRTSDNKPVAIEGLWGLSFGNDAHGQPRSSLFFAAGPGDEAHGLYGDLQSTPR